ncbi:hypothetical protein [Tuwongella immobilis]|uniref:Uncharacterized protein n=1 Tax=Tuwongella immobilis TaxID=692036 RepID=A0A6C2YSD1_9BACT|nr:hypothetical protein [Tuwongella immobilis]VIP03782.1 unnamed protein product [Tuwongella immobilis]VTS04932.1 unnamed protein product [Tuwongella immobilis]
MSNVERLQASLDNLAMDGRFPIFWQESLADSASEVRAVFERVEPLGVSARSVSWAIDCESNPMPFAAWCRYLEASFEALGESIRCLECDESHGQALFRSAKPTEWQGLRRYFEARIDGTTRVELSRYSVQLAQPTRREIVPMVLTREQLLRTIASVFPKQCG